MGTITITEYTSIGGAGAVDGAPVANLSGSITTTTDATTSTTAESITLNADTRFVRIVGVEKHRVSVKDSTAASNYDTVEAGIKEDFAINQSDRTLYYRLDA